MRHSNRHKRDIVSGTARNQIYSGITFLKGEFSTRSEITFRGDLWSLICPDGDLHTFFFQVSKKLIPGNRASDFEKGLQNKVFGAFKMPIPGNFRFDTWEKNV